MARTPIHPGEHLAEELRDLGLSAAELARQTEVPVNRITGIINGQRGVTADTALRFAEREIGDKVRRLPTLTARISA